LLQFYNKRKTYFAHDPQQQCLVGDIVLLKALPVRRTKHVKHELAEIVYKVGKVIDPVTGKPCAGSKLLESVTDSENLTDRDTSFLSEKLQELTVSSPDK
ncbi:PREDICTED: 28S ribosomal protein S17, mitochondrial, partial [Gekko japonicus]|uniref:28S ribosomal protein S17, mitochondrial n=1 Tax=Gekko japonicus TaxID=146911 RepID=A0ABM1K5X5_GEKJA